MSIHDTQPGTPPDTLGIKPSRSQPDWITYRGYLGIALGGLAAFFLTAQATGWGQLVFVVIWVAVIAAIVSYTRYDRRRRTIREEQ